MTPEIIDKTIRLGSRLVQHLNEQMPQGFRLTLVSKYSAFTTRNMVLVHPSGVYTDFQMRPPQLYESQRGYQIVGISQSRPLQEYLAEHWHIRWAMYGSEAAFDHTFYEYFDGRGINLIPLWANFDTSELNVEGDYLEKKLKRRESEWKQLLTTAPLDPLYYSIEWKSRDIFEVIFYPRAGACYYRRNVGSTDPLRLLPEDYALFGNQVRHERERQIRASYWQHLDKEINVAGDKAVIRTPISQITVPATINPEEKLQEILERSGIYQLIAE